MEVVGGSAGEQRFRFTHSAAWHGAHADFNRVVEGGDPGQLVELLEWGCPYHAPALLALSELAGLTNEAQRCADLLERALHSFESAWHPALAGALAAGSARMDGRAPENAPFFDALFRHAALLGRKGCVRTALEVCKLLLCLDASDPRGALCCVDYFALRAGQAPWLLRFAHRFRGDGALPSLPGFAFSLPLAAWGEAGGEAGAAAAAADERLRAALLLHPAAAAALVQRLASVNALALDGEWAAALGAAPFAGAAAAAAASASLERLTELFVERHAPLWRPLAAQAWLKAAMLRCAEEAATPAGRAAAADWALLRAQAFPPGEPNAFAHLQPAAFSDAPPRQLPAENNPFLAANRRPAEAAGGELRLEELMAGLPPQQRQQLQRIMEEEAAARAQRDAPAAGEGPAGAGAAAAGANPLRLFLETLFRPDAAAARAARPRPPPGAEGLLHEEGDSEDSFSGDEEEWDGAAQAAAGGGGAAEFEDVPQAWQEEWAEMRAAAVGNQVQEPVLDEEWDAPD